MTNNQVETQLVVVNNPIQQPNRLAGNVSFFDSNGNSLPFPSNLDAKYVSVNQPPLNPYLYGFDPSAIGSVNRTSFTNDINALGSSGGHIQIRMPGTYLISGGSIAIPSNVTISGTGPNTVIKNDVGSSTPVFVNADTVNGNTNIIFRDFSIDGNNTNRLAASSYNVVTMNNLSYCNFSNLTVSNGAYGASLGTGCGLSFSRMTRSVIQNVTVIGNEYDGVILGGSTFNHISKLVGVNNGRNTILLTRYPIGSGTTPSQFNTISQVSHEHSTGTPTTGVPTTGVVYTHMSNYNMFNNVVAYGTRMGIGGGESSIGNIFTNLTLQTRWVDRAAICFEQVNSTSNQRWKISGVTIRPLSGAGGLIAKFENAVFNSIRDVTFYVGGGSGSWGINLDNSSVDNEISGFADVGGIAPTVTDTGSRNSIGYILGGSLKVLKSGGTVVSLT